MLKKIFTTTLLLVLVLDATSQKNYRGAEIYSSQSHKYGKMEMRMRMAKGSGILSTFFTYKNGSEVSGAFWEEIDIEVFGKNNATTFQSNIITNNPRKYSEEVHSPGFSMAEGYHTYVLEWTPSYVAWYLDGVLIRKTVGAQSAELTNAQSLRFNLWASDVVSWVGTFDTQALPAYQFVNWIKYSSYTPGAGDNGTDFTLSWTDEFNTFNTSRWSKANWTFDGNLVNFEPNNVLVKDGYLVMALTTATQTGFSGTVPVDNMVTEVSDHAIHHEHIRTFPNPFNTSIKIEATDGTPYIISDMLGQVVEQGTIYSSHAVGASLPKGMYMLQVNTSADRILRKIIKE
ncbi:MAG TPA: family 16 glycosylhydrolase [Cytophagales bacterium]|nr:family 16 glycosylhydrolase [Cytophagales bacterium]